MLHEPKSARGRAHRRSMGSLMGTATVRIVAAQGVAELDFLSLLL